MKLDFKALLALIPLIGMGVSAHFMGLATAKEYTDVKHNEIIKNVDKKEQEQLIRYDRVLDKLELVDRNVTKLQTIMEHVTKKIEKL